jgi:hypothetical protein
MVVDMAATRSSFSLFSLAILFVQSMSLFADVSTAKNLSPCKVETKELYTSRPLVGPNRESIAKKTSCYAKRFATIKARASVAKAMIFMAATSGFAYWTYRSYFAPVDDGGNKSIESDSLNSVYLKKLSRMGTPGGVIEYVVLPSLIASVSFSAFESGKNAFFGWVEGASVWFNQMVIVKQKYRLFYSTVFGMMSAFKVAELRPESSLILKDSYINLVLSLEDFVGVVKGKAFVSSDDEVVCLMPLERVLDEFTAVVSKMVTAFEEDEEDFVTELRPSVNSLKEIFVELDRAFLHYVQA